MSASQLKDTKSVWKHVKNLLSWHSSSSPSKLSIGQNIISKPKQIAEHLNDHFINKVKSLSNNIPATSIDPLNYVRNITRDKDLAFQFTCISPDDTENYLRNLKSSRSCAHDFLDNSTLKSISDIIKFPLTHIINLCISKNHFSKLWKIHRVVPLHKKDDKLLASNYRPIALLPAIGKLIEKVLFDQLVSYFENNNLFVNSQHGFRKNHSTISSLIHLYDNLIQSVE